MRQERAHISLNSRTKEALDSIRAPGQSYDGIIQELIAQWNENHSKRGTVEGKRREIKQAF
jgi:hypothetical protein